MFSFNIQLGAISFGFTSFSYFSFGAFHLVLQIVLCFNVLLAFDGMSVCFIFTLCLISCDGYLIEGELYSHNCNVNSMSFAWLHVIFQLHGYRFKMVAWYFSCLLLLLDVKHSMSSLLNVLFGKYMDF